MRPATTGITLACCHNWHSIGVLPQLALHWRPTGRLGAEALGVRLPFHRALESFPIGRFNFACSSNMRVTTVDSSTYEWWWQKYYEKGTEDQTVTVSNQGQFPRNSQYEAKPVRGTVSTGRSQYGAEPVRGRASTGLNHYGAQPVRAATRTCLQAPSANRQI